MAEKREKHRKRRRVRVITDTAKYRRHRRKKWVKVLTKVLIVVLWTAAAIAAVFFIWYVLDMLFTPRPQV